MTYKMKCKCLCIIHFLPIVGKQRIFRVRYHCTRRQAVVFPLLCLPLFQRILWSIWRARNACLWEQKSTNEHASCVLALDTVRDFMWCNRPNDTMQSPTPGWSKMQADWIKCNVDCALFEAEEKFSVGICF